MLGILAPFLVLLIAAFFCLWPSVIVAYVACFFGSVAFLCLLIWYLLQGWVGPFQFSFIGDIQFILDLDFLGTVFAVMVAVLFVCASWYAICYLHLTKDKHQNRFLFFYTLSVWASIGLAFSGNLMTMFIFYELLTVFTYPLIVHSGTQEAKSAGRVYLLNLIGASLVFLLPAMAFLHLFDPTMSFETIKGLDLSWGEKLVLFLALTYGVAKVALFPLHSWLPRAMVAPTPVSALLHAVAVVKGGIFVLIKIYAYLFATANLEGINIFVSYLAAFGVLFASFMALSKTEIKARLAYSTISQLSYMVISASLLTTAGLESALMHMVSHSFAKISLFFLAGIFYLQGKIEHVTQMSGLARKMPLTVFLFAVSCAAVIGLPLTGVFWSKLAIFSALGEVNGMVLICVTIFATVLNVAYMFPTIYSAYAGPEELRNYSDPPLYLMLPVFFAILAAVLSFFIRLNFSIEIS